MLTISGWVWRIGGVVGILWLVGMTLLAPPSISQLDDHDPKIVHRLKRAVHELDLLKNQNDDIRTVLQEFAKQIKVLGEKSDEDEAKQSLIKNDLQKKLDNAQKMLEGAGSNLDAGGSDIIPSLQFEKTRRLLGNGVQETWWFLQSQLKELKKSLGPSEAKQINYIMEESKNHLRVVEHDLNSLSNLDGLRQWRKKEAQDLSALVQKHLHALQNPLDCAHANKLICNVNKGCGYGCQIHHIVYCLITAYGSNRTLILKSKGWRYNRNGWEDVFQPISQTCTDPGGMSHSHWPGSLGSQVIDLPIIDTIAPRPDYLPLAIPRDLSDKLMRLHGNPASWWVGQFLMYLLKPQPKTKEMLDSFQKEMGFQSPIVGIHIRRTDKVGTEAAFHSIEEYMEHVEDYYKTFALREPHFEKKVYVASDDPSVLADARRKFPDYTFLGDPSIAKTAAVATRYSDASLRGIITDIHFLSLTDYIVCTFSSQVCRIAFEIMQTYHTDASNKFRSLDDIYYYGGQNSHNQRARFPHTARNAVEMNLDEGDMVGIAGNHWNGFSKGVNRRTGQNAMYPSYKAEEVVEVADMPS